MAVVTIPVDASAQWYDLAVTLDNVTYSLTFRWNDRDQAWYMDVALEDGTPIANMQGIKIVVDFPLGYRSTDPNRPPGAIVAEDTSGNRLDPGFSDLGTRVILLYFEASELPA